MFSSVFLLSESNATASSVLIAVDLQQAAAVGALAGSRYFFAGFSVVGAAL